MKASLDNEGSSHYDFCCQLIEPKSEHSRRHLDLSPSLALFLKQHKARREAECLLIGEPLGEYDLVFSNVDGTPMYLGTLTHNFARIAKRAGLAGVHFQDLRYTFASLMLLGDVHPKIVSEMLGHSSVAFTLDTYSHVIGGLQKAAMRRPDEILQPKLEQTEGVSKMLAKNTETYTASGRTRTYTKRFTKSGSDFDRFYRPLASQFRP